jgi:multiple sugar transport system permease protein
MAEGVAVPTPRAAFGRGAARPNVGRAVRLGAAYTALTVLGLLWVAPFLWMVFTSLKSPVEAYRVPPTIVPQVWAWGNYAQALSLLPFGRFYLNSAVVAGLITVGQLVTCSLGAYAFARLRFPFRGPLFVAYLATMMIPFEVTMIPVFVMMRTLGWIDTYPALIVPHLFSAYGTFLLRQFFLTLPRELEDAARIDGCGHFQTYWRIALPLSGPALATLGTFVFMWAWNQLMWPLIVTNSLEMRTIPFGLAMFLGENRTIEWNLLMAAATAALLPMIAVFLFFQRYFVEGITLTGIKG